MEPTELLFRFEDGRYLYAVVPRGGMPRVFYGQESPLPELPVLSAITFRETGAIQARTDPFWTLFSDGKLASITWGGFLGPCEWGRPVPPVEWSASVADGQVVLFELGGSSG